MKTIAFDCAFFKDHNGISQCFSNIGPANFSNLDYSSYKPDKDLVEDASQIIAKLFQENFILKLSDIQEGTSKYGIQNRIIYAALERIIQNKIKIFDVYGRSGFIIFRGDYYVFTPDGMRPNVSLWQRMVPPPNV